ARLGGRRNPRRPPGAPPPGRLSVDAVGDHRRARPLRRSRAARRTRARRARRRSRTTLGPDATRPPGRSRGERRARDARRAGPPRVRAHDDAERARAVRPWLVPEVIQTSQMDCGPASLKSLLEGLGIQVSYGRLREACQTDVDGTSIDTLEELARRLGVDAEQVVIPFEHVFLEKEPMLPAIAVM